jgi:DNA-binding NtrC family response regulator
VARVKSDLPDCVLMDIKMPGINGVEAMKQMKKIAPMLPIVLVSAYATDDLLEEAKQVGAYAILSKPLNFPIILSFLSLLDKEESILVVDDDPEFCTTLGNILTLQDFQVETETEPRSVLGHLEHNYKLTIVLLDLKLGTVNGVEVLKDIQNKYPGKPVVLMTGYRKEMTDTIEQARKIGAYTCLYKPFEMDALLQLIEEIRIKKLQSMLLSS